MPELAVPRTAPKDHLWATENDPVTTNFAKSQEFALDNLMPDWQQYPSWPNYPDERNLPVGLAAREAWAKRRPLRLAELERLAGQNTPPKKIRPTTATILPKESSQTESQGTNLCPVCKTNPLPISTTKPRKFCSNACKKKASRTK